ncbi:threonine/serine exporter family protein [Mycobacterium deserti]|uniref:Threonine/serine exporter family protein n=1 Tax=Mycobacterium deserti TaxID=2978347 RepID=A0ABT2MFE0_9MYCO|nr:threonine/serine exporter family protein [Mycobacterium deserti]MCT7660100.1 threonine/serine exporter family protein [Mycobacterium deserti]
MPSPDRGPAASASRFVTELGATMSAANYPVTMVRDVMGATSKAYGLDHQFLALPNYVQVGGAEGNGLYIANPDFDLRYDQSFPLAQLVARAPTGTVQPAEGLAELARIRSLDRRFPVWLTVLGYAVQSTGLALILQPTQWSLAGAAVLGLLVGVLAVVGRRIDAVGYMLPTLCAFLVALAVFTFENHWHVGVDSLRALAAPLATFLPGAAITLAVIELSTRHVVSGASRLVAGFMQIVQLAFGILIAAQVAGIADTDLVTTEINRLGPWAPFLGVLVYGLGAMLYFGPPTRFLPWMVLMLYSAYAGQWVGNALLGSYASGFGGGLTLILFALAISHRPNTPPTVSLVLPGFWLLVPGSLGFMGVTQLLGTHDTAIFTATLISMMSIAVGVQTGLLLWRAAIQLTDAPHRRAFHD